MPLEGRCALPHVEPDALDCWHAVRGQLDDKGRFLIFLEEDIFEQQSDQDGHDDPQRIQAKDDQTGLPREEDG